MERDKFDKLITATLPQIERTVRIFAARYNLGHEWEDIAQTALLKMLRFAEKYNPERGDFIPWAWVVILNTIKTRLTQISSAPSTCELFDFSKYLPSRSNPESDLQAAIIESNLNREARLFVEGYNYREIAALCGYKSRTTVMARIDHCAARLRRVFDIERERVNRRRIFSK